MSGFEIESVERIIEAAKRNRLSVVRIKSGESSLRIEIRGGSASGSEPAQAPDAKSVGSRSAEHIVVRSPMVGFFRLAGSVASEGERVQPDSVIGSIEALGLPNDVPAGTAGTLDELLVEDGQAVEYGQAIARIRP